MLQHHKAYDAKEFEQQNILNELVTRIYVGDSDTISSIVLNTNAFWKISAWTTSLKTGFIALTILVPVIVLACVALYYFRIRQLKHQVELAEFAVRLNNMTFDRDWRNSEPVDGLLNSPRRSCQTFFPDPLGAIETTEL